MQQNVDLKTKVKQIESDLAKITTDNGNVLMGLQRKRALLEKEKSD